MSKGSESIADSLSMYRALSSELDEIVGGSLLPVILDATALSPIRRRLFLRSAFSFMEAIAFRLKQYALEVSTSSNLSDTDKVICSETSVELDDKGKVVERSLKLRFLPNLRFAFEVFGRAIGADLKLDTSRAEWQSLYLSVRVRDRLMHPKLATDLEVTDDEIRDAVSGWRWVIGELVVCFVLACHQYMETDPVKWSSELSNVESILRYLRPDGLS